MSIPIASNRISALIRALNTAKFICYKHGVNNPPIIGGFGSPPRTVIILDANNCNWENTKFGDPVGIFLE